MESYSLPTILLTRIGKRAAVRYGLCHIIIVFDLLRYHSQNLFDEDLRYANYSIQVCYDQVSRIYRNIKLRVVKLHRYIDLSSISK